jgi:hypothetical protein
VTAGVLDAVGALAVSVAKIFIAILASVALASGVAGDIIGSPIGVQAANEKTTMHVATISNNLRMITSLKKSFSVTILPLQGHPPRVRRVRQAVVRRPCLSRLGHGISYQLGLS